MKLTDKMQDVINKQINAEMWSANFYTSMSVHFASLGLNGFANWLKVQSREELEHAEDMMQYLLNRGGKVKIGAVDAVPVDFGTPLSIMQELYKHECKVSEMIEHVVSVASMEKDMPSQDFFWKYIREQVEEEANSSNIVDQLVLAGDNGSAILMIDRELNQRTV